MFLNYDKISSCYKPNNLECASPSVKSYTKLDPLKASKPFEHYNAKGELIGYFWQYGETLNLEFNIDGEIVIESDAYVYRAAGDGPNLETRGKIGQRAYNITDLRSWTCIQIVDNKYIWEEDSEFIHDGEDAIESVYVTAEDFLKNKQAEFIIYNFRLEPIYTSVDDAKTKLIYPIDTELSKKLVKGIYYCSLSIFDEQLKQQIFGSTDCTLLVK